MLLICLLPWWRERTTVTLSGMGAGSFRPSGGWLARGTGTGCCATSGGASRAAISAVPAAKRIFMDTSPLLLLLPLRRGGRWADDLHVGHLNVGDGERRDGQFHERGFRCQGPRQHLLVEAPLGHQLAE